MDELDRMSTDDDDTTSIVKVREAKAILEDITAQHPSPLPTPRPSWWQRLLTWFRADP